MIPPALFALRRVGWRLQHDARSLCYGALIGLLGAGGQMLLFHAVRTGPAYLIFPVISLSPVVTVVLSMALLHERTGKLGALGIVLALCSLPLFDYAGGAEAARPTAMLWFLPALGVLAAWGVQAFFMKLANATMDAESIFFYMTVSGPSADAGGARDDGFFRAHQLGCWTVPISRPPPRFSIPSAH